MNSKQKSKKLIMDSNHLLNENLSEKNTPKISKGESKKVEISLNGQKLNIKADLSPLSSPQHNIERNSSEFNSKNIRKTSYSNQRRGTISSLGYNTKKWENIRRRNELGPLLEVLSEQELNKHSNEPFFYKELFLSVSKIIYTRAVYYRVNHCYKQALKLFQKILHIARSTDLDQNVDFLHLRGKIMMVIGAIHLETDNQELALSFYQQGFEEFVCEFKIRNNPLIFRDTNRKKQKIIKAVKHILIALEMIQSIHIFDKRGPNLHQIYCCNNLRKFIADLYFEDYDLLFQRFERSHKMVDSKILSSYKEHQQIEGLIFPSLHQMMIASKMNQFDEDLNSKFKKSKLKVYDLMKISSQEIEKITQKNIVRQSQSKHEQKVDDTFSTNYIGQDNISGNGQTKNFQKAIIPLAYNVFKRSKTAALKIKKSKEKFGFEEKKQQKNKKKYALFSISSSKDLGRSKSFQRNHSFSNLSSTQYTQTQNTQIKKFERHQTLDSNKKLYKKFGNSNNNTPKHKNQNVFMTKTCSSKMKKRHFNTRQPSKIIDTANSSLILDRSIHCSSSAKRQKKNPRVPSQMKLRAFQKVKTLAEVVGLRKTNDDNDSLKSKIVTQKHYLFDNQKYGEYKKAEILNLKQTFSEYELNCLPIPLKRRLYKKKRIKSASNFSFGDLKSAIRNDEPCLSQKREDILDSDCIGIDKVFQHDIEEKLIKNFDKKLTQFYLEAAEQNKQMAAYKVESGFWKRIMKMKNQKNKDQKSGREKDSEFHSKKMIKQHFDSMTFIRNTKKHNKKKREIIDKIKQDQKIQKNSKSKNHKRTKSHGAFNFKPKPNLRDIILDHSDFLGLETVKKYKRFQKMESRGQLSPLKLNRRNEFKTPLIKIEKDQSQIFRNVKKHLELTIQDISSENLWLQSKLNKGFSIKNQQMSRFQFESLAEPHNKRISQFVQDHSNLAKSTKDKEFEARKRQTPNSIYDLVNLQMEIKKRKREEERTTMQQLKEQKESQSKICKGNIGQYRSEVSISFNNSQNKLKYWFLQIILWVLFQDLTIKSIKFKINGQIWRLKKSAGMYG